MICVHTGSEYCWDLYSTVVGVLVDDFTVHIGIEVMSSLTQNTERAFGAIITNSFI